MRVRLPRVRVRLWWLMVAVAVVLSAGHWGPEMIRRRELAIRRAKSWGREE